MIHFSEIIRLLAFALFTAYVIGIRKYDVHSISQSDYKLKHFKYLFEIVMFVSGISIGLSCVMMDNTIAHYALIIGGIGIFGVGIFPKYQKNKFNSRMHVICAFGGFLVTVIAILFAYWPFGLAIGVATIIIHLKTKEDHNHTLTVELVLAYGIFISLELMRFLGIN